MGLLARALALLGETQNDDEAILVAGAPALSEEGKKSFTGNRLEIYRTESLAQNRVPYALEFSMETLIGQLITISKDTGQAESAKEQWNDFLEHFTQGNGFVLQDDMRSILISSSEGAPDQEALVSEIAAHASDIFGIETEPDWFEPYLYPLDQAAIERLTPLLPA